MRLSLAMVMVASVLASGCGSSSAPPSLIPWPAAASIGGGDRVGITKTSRIEVSPGEPALQRMGADLAALLRPALDATLEVHESTNAATAGVIRLEIDKTVEGDEAYALNVATNGISIAGRTPAGVFYGLQTLRQLLPSWIELRGVRPREVTLPQAHITDAPRFAWRGAMLDVARHFFSPPELKRYIDLLAMYKFNHLHLHLSDDQGWRIEISSWPNLTAHGSKTSVGGGPGGFYTKQDYADIIAYAGDRFITIVPEIDMPSHINAALSSYPELNCNGVAPAPYTGIDVGFSSFCVDKDITYKFIDDVFRELAEMTPGPYLHIGGDEVKTLTQAQYNAFIERVQPIVEQHGKIVIGWDEVIHAKLLPKTVVQYWRPDASIKPAAHTKLILSPANKIYLDMKYDNAAVLGLNWAGNVDVGVPYGWDPATLLPGVETDAILGVEAPIWSETVTKISDLELLAFPRIAEVAEVAWSPQSARTWANFRPRLAAQAPRWSALGINAYWSPKIDWVR